MCIHSCHMTMLAVTAECGVNDDGQQRMMCNNQWVNVAAGFLPLVSSNNAVDAAYVQTVTNHVFSVQQVVYWWGIWLWLWSWQWRKWKVSVNIVVVFMVLGWLRLLCEIRTNNMLRLCRIEIGDTDDQEYYDEGIPATEFSSGSQPVWYASSHWNRLFIF